MAGVVILLALAVFAPCVTGQVEESALLRIVSVEYPRQVPRSHSFAVEIRVEYAFRDYSDIYAAIYESPQGKLERLLWRSDTEHLIRVGDRTYQIQLKSPSIEKQWLLTAYVFFRNVTGLFYFTDREHGPGFAEVSIKVADNAKLTVHTPYGNVPIWVDGTERFTDANGFLVNDVRVLAEHTIAAPDELSIISGWRAVFVGWNGTDSANPITLIVRNDIKLAAEFRDEFYLDIVSDIGGVRGTGWYRSGAVANFSATAIIPSEGWEGLFGVRHRFTGWSGDVVSGAPNESIVMDRPSRVVASWSVDYSGSLYLVTIVAALGVVGLAALLVRRTTTRGSEEIAEPAVKAFCMFCGAEIDPDASFCSKCGKSQLSSS